MPNIHNIPPLMRKQTMRDKLWHAIRILEKFTIHDLMLRTGATRSNTEAFIRYLAQAGFVVILRKIDDGKPTSNGLNLYKLMRNTGNQTPFYSFKYQKLIDPNPQTPQRQNNMTNL